MTRRGPWSAATQQEVRRLVAKQGFLTEQDRQHFMLSEDKSFRAIANLEYSTLRELRKEGVLA